MEEHELDRLERFLRSLGATDDELAEARRTEGYGDLALELTVRRAGPLVPFPQAAARAGLGIEEAGRYWRALGFPDPTLTCPDLPDEAVEALGLIAGVGREFLGDDTTLALARVVGSATWQMAQAVVDAFRVRFETPQLAAGVAYPEVVEGYVGIVREVLPSFVDAMGALFVRHLVTVAAGSWSTDAEGVATRRDVVVGFADLVGWSAMSRTLSPGGIVGVVEEFERVVAETVALHGGRVVKLIGDGAMFTADDAGRACALALELAGRAAASDHLPPVRVGLSAGPAVSRNGDLFGDVVNLAARLVAAADEGSVVADEAVRSRVPDGFRFDALAPRSLKGFDPDTAAYLVRHHPA